MVLDVESPICCYLVDSCNIMFDCHYLPIFQEGTCYAFIINSIVLLLNIFYT